MGLQYLSHFLAHDTLHALDRSHTYLSLTRLAASGLFTDGKPAAEHL